MHRRSDTGTYLVLLLVLLTWSIQSYASEADDAGPLVSNVFYETDLREALLSIADQAGVPIIVDGTVGGYVTMELSGVPLEECLTRILSPMGFAHKKIGDHYLVGSASPDSPSFHLLSETELYRPSFIRAEDVPLLLSTYYEKYIRVDKVTNTVSLMGPHDIVKRLKEDLAVIDQAPRQIMIDVLVTEMTEESLKEFGFDGEFSAEKDGRKAGAVVPLGTVSDSSVHIIGVRTGDVWKKWSINYEVALQALFMDGKVNVRANPKLATVEGKTARIFVGKDEYHTIATGGEQYQYTRLEVIKVGISLEITPYISEDGRITVDAKTSVSDVAGMGVTGLPVVSTRDVSTRITVPNGESIIIGGLQNEIERSSIKKFPLLGDIPLLGVLFRNNSKETLTTNIVIVITPHLIEGNESGIVVETPEG